MFFSILDNSLAGILSVIAFLIITISLGDSIRRILKVGILHTFLDSVCFAILSTITISLVLQFLNLYTYLVILSIIILGFFVDLWLFKISTGFKSLNENIKKFFVSKPSLKEIYASIRPILLNNKYIVVIWVFVFLYQFLFVLLPAIIYPLPLETDMKQHTIFLILITKESTIFPSWTPIVPTLDNVLYELGGHIYAAFGYNSIAFLSVPEVTYLNFWFRIHYLICFYMIVYLSYSLFKEIMNSKLYSTFNLLLTPAFFWITRLGGFPCIMGFIILIFLIKLCFNTFLVEKSEISHYKIWISQLLIFWAYGLLGFIHINVIFYAFLFVNVLSAHILFFHRNVLKFNLILILITFLSDFFYTLLITSPNLLFQFLPSTIQVQLYGTYIITDVGNFSFTDVFVVNYFLGGLFSTCSAIIFFLFPTYKNKSALYVIFNWLLVMFLSFIIIEFSIEPLNTVFYHFTSVQFFIKIMRLFYFTFFMLAIFSPVLWKYIINLPYKNIKTALTTFFIISICGFSLISAYSLALPVSRDYSSYTIDAYEYIRDNIPPGSLFLNDFRGQLIPSIADMRITFTADPLFNYTSSTETVFVFWHLFSFVTDHPEYINITDLLSAKNFGAPVNYIFITTYVFNDIAWKFGSAVADGITNRSIWDFQAFNGLVLIYSNPEVAIYQVIR